MFRPSKSFSIEQLRAKAEKSAAVAKRDATAVTYMEQSVLAQRVVTRQADELQARIDDDARWNAERNEVSGRLGVAQRNAWDLSERIERARTATDDALKAGDVNKASEHGMAVGSMTLTLQRAQQLVAELQQEFARIPVADITDAERACVVELRAIGQSPEKSYEYVVPSLTVDKNAELRALGRRVAQEQLEHPTLQRQGFPAMRDTRGVA